MSTELIGDLNLEGLKTLTEKLNKYASDPELDYYILSHNMIQNGDELNYEYLDAMRKGLIRKLDSMIGDASIENDEFNDEESEVIEQIETVLDSIDNVIEYIKD